MRFFVSVYYSNILCYTIYMNSKEKGDYAAGQAIAYFMSNGYEVCLPIGDKRAYDMVVESEGVLKRVQVKYAGYYARDKNHKAALRTMGGNQSYHTTKKYKDDDFELLFVYTANGRKFVLPWREIKNRNEVSVETSKFAIYEVK